MGVVFLELIGTPQDFAINGNRLPYQGLNPKKTGKAGGVLLMVQVQQQLACGAQGEAEGLRMTLAGATAWDGRLTHQLTIQNLFLRMK